LALWASHIPERASLPGFAFCSLEIPIHIHVKILGLVFEECAVVGWKFKNLRLQGGRESQY
jgi:hypothetical protein